MILFIILFAAFVTCFGAMAVYNMFAEYEDEHKDDR